MFGANMERFEVLCKSDQKRLVKHLKKFRVIAVRDLVTKNYLEKFGVEQNTLVFPDPIFHYALHVFINKVKLKQLA